MPEQTSILAYRELETSGKILTQKQQILGVMRVDCNYTNKELEEATGLPINVVTARVHALAYDDNLVLPAGTRRCKLTGNLVKCWMKRK